ncbi:HalOD1 output domain-containing protein [Halopelagius longus]|uniref:Halobacterial output domain-containing protein n=1 Tax=Halopelagius longus TaxID=1236180 RepID=A0A1H0Z6D1_9EURY|nr:HalOD1 output domain-containing protein [Halopelagius longus]RDI72855.1 hypothetical protein DWB78_14600 [Halopelagius longus]SDQ23029.1 hypothetical protein SAMN05216278_1043 [Halopelagius longus]
MDDHPERRRYYPDDEDIALSEVVLEAVQAHENASFEDDEFPLYDHIHPDAIDMLFKDTSGVDVSVRIHLTNVTVSLWSDGGVDIRVTDNID